MATGPLHERSSRSSIGRWFESARGVQQRRQTEENERRRILAEHQKKKVAAEIKQKMTEIGKKVLHFETKTTVLLNGQSTTIYGYRILKGGRIELAFTRYTEGNQQLYVEVALSDLGQDFLNFLNENF